MKVLYLDLFSGISGDMFLGALLDLGVDVARLEEELRKLPVQGYHLHARRGHKAGIEGVKFDVHEEGENEASHTGHEQGHGHEHPHVHDSHAHVHDTGDEHGHSHRHDHEHHHQHGDEDDHEHGRNYQQIRELISNSGLSDWVKQKAISVFHRIAVAEGKVHGLPPEQVAFHEVGAIDSIVDIVGACIALELLGKPRVLSASPIEGTGWINCAHGRFPIPAPATLAILGARGVAVSQCEEAHELITPTGAALLAEFAESFGPMQQLVAEKIGYGLGARDNRTRPNVLRAVLGQAAAAQPASGWETDRVIVLETNLDDITAEVLGHTLESALSLGALDVFHTPIQMKKNRPGVLLTVLCAEPDADKFTELLLRQTSAFGVRRYTAERRKLSRKFTTVRTPYGEVTVKLGLLNGQILHAAPEYEACRKVAADKQVPLRTVYEAAVRALPESGPDKDDRH